MNCYNLFDCWMESLNLENNKEYPYTVDNYEFTGHLGKGSFGTVHQVRNLNNQKFACKQISKNGGPSIEKILKQINIHKSIGDNPCVVQYYTYFQDANYYYIILQYCSNGDLGKFHLKYDDLDPNEIFKQMITGYRSLLTQKVVHRDLKLQNFLVHQDGIVKLGDFGLSKIMLTELTKTCTGSLHTMAPEVIQCHPKYCINKSGDDAPSYGYKCDIWSLGVIYYQLLYKGALPFGQINNNTNYHQYLKTIKAEQIRFPNDSRVCEESKQFIRMCLKIDPKKRIDFHDIYYHPLFMTYPTQEETINNCMQDKLSEDLKEFYISSLPFLNINYPMHYIHTQKNNGIYVEDKPNRLFRFYYQVYIAVKEYNNNRIRFVTRLLQNVIKIKRLKQAIKLNRQQLNPSIQEHQKQKALIRFQQVVGYLIIAETEIQNNLMIQKIKNKQNIFKFPDFEQFTNNKKYEYQKLISMFEKSGEQIGKILQQKRKNLPAQYIQKMIKNSNKQQIEQYRINYLYCFITKLHSILKALKQSEEIEDLKMSVSLIRFLINQICKIYHVQAKLSTEIITNVFSSINYLIFLRKIWKEKKDKERQIKTNQTK